MKVDVAMVGAGAAGLHCAAIAGQLGASVLLIDHSAKVAEKIRISGGGRCNFTNIDAGPAHFDSANPDFCRSALASYRPSDFIRLVEQHGIAWHEKHQGQLFCDSSSGPIVEMLLAECGAGGVIRWQPCEVSEVRRSEAGFALETTRGPVSATRLVVASGGLSIPKAGASDWGYRLARRFGHRIVEPRPALVPFLCSSDDWRPFEALAGVALPVRMRAAQGPSFDDDLLFTHRGLSGPAALQVSTFWRPGETIEIDLAPDGELGGLLRDAKRQPGRTVRAVLGHALPRRLVDAWLAASPTGADARAADVRDRDLASLAGAIARWSVRPTGTEGYRKAEVTAGGIDTRELDSRTFESRRVAGLYFIGEIVDVTGWLGGYNFQWAWASAAACARAVGSHRPDLAGPL